MIKPLGSCCECVDRRLHNLPPNFKDEMTWGADASKEAQSFRFYHHVARDVAVEDFREQLWDEPHE